MSLQNKIRTLREINQLTQEEMAEKLLMSKNGYAKLERGESKIKLEQLEKLATIFDIDVIELINHEKGFNYWVGVEQNHGHNTTYYNHDSNSIQEIEKLNLIIAHKDELLLQKENENQALKQLIEVLKKK